MAVSLASLITGALSAFVGGAALSPVEIVGGIDLELGPIRQERNEIQERIETAPQPDVKDSILLNLNQLTEYYTINKAQARSSFRASLFAIIVGLLTIVGGIWIFYLGSSRSIQLTAISAIGGVLIEFIGGAYFILYNKTSAQSHYLYDRLVRTQDTMLAVSLCSGIDDSSLRNDTTRQIVMALMNREAPGADVYATSTAAAGNNSPSVPTNSPAKSTTSRVQPSRARRGSEGGMTAFVKPTSRPYHSEDPSASNRESEVRTAWPCRSPARLEEKSHAGY
jgi:hypothetical protein